MILGERGASWSRLDERFDLVVVGGGITGAGLAAEAARAGARVVLLEQRDFAWGTSSRSSKLVHGGLRYLKQGHFRLTRKALLERERLIRERPGLVDRVGFLVAMRDDERLQRRMFGLGLTLYDVLAWRWQHQWLDPEAFLGRAPHVGTDHLAGGFRYHDARTDDARLTLRVLAEAVGDGAVVLNHARVEGLLKAEGRVSGVRVRDGLGGREAEVQGKVVVNATGAWADQLRATLGARPRIRPLRGSHFTFPAWRLPAPEAIMFLHPQDARPIFVIPWEGVTLVGTTDLDHRDDLGQEPAMSEPEADYLIAGLRRQFPGLQLRRHDALATFCGVRPVVGSGKAKPSQEARDHVVWQEDGLLTVTGGKLTTFRIIARDALRAVARTLPLDLDRPPRAAQMDLEDLDVDERLLGRHGFEVAQRISRLAQAGELELVPGTLTPWVELRLAAREESVGHLDDLLLRRTRLGLLLPEGGAAILPRVKAICQGELGWDEARWAQEEADYLRTWQRAYSVPGVT
jgi:glycerol-3-phosphate dehydrogenase